MENTTSLDEDTRPKLETLGHLFQYGPTKSAVILKNMVDDIDQKFNTRTAHRRVGRFLNTLDDLLSPLTDKSMSNSMKTRLGFWEGRAWQHVNYIINETDTFDIFPAEMVYMIRAVAKEKIIRAKVVAGLDEKKDHGYTTKDIPDWAKSDLSRMARGRWKQSLSGFYARAHPANLLIQ
jgi:hypothetical protein